MYDSRIASCRFGIRYANWVEQDTAWSNRHEYSH